MAEKAVRVEMERVVPSTVGEAREVAATAEARDTGEMVPTAALEETAGR